MTVLRILRNFPAYIKGNLGLGQAGAWGIENRKQHPLEEVGETKLAEKLLVDEGWP